MSKKIKTVEMLEKELSKFTDKIQKNKFSFTIDIRNISNVANYSYHENQEKKKSGKTRIIHAPSHRLKYHQALINEWLKQFYNPLAHVYGVKGKGYTKSGMKHTECDYLICVDLKDFFPSISIKRVYAQFRMLGCSKEVAWLLSKICCKDGGLVQGSPASSILANMICLGLDKEISEKCALKDWININPEYLKLENQFTVSRVVDDITISVRRHRPGMWKGSFNHKSLLTEIIDFIITSIKKHGFKVNYRKVKVYHRGMRQSINGLTVNEKNNVNRQWLRNLRAQIHQATISKIASHSGGRQISGKLAHLRQVKGESDKVYLNLKSLFEEAFK